MSQHLPPAAPSPEQVLKPLLDAESARTLSRQIDSVAWGTLFVWFGAVWFAEINWHWGIAGAGAIFLVEAIIRWAKDLRVSGMAVLFGLMFLTGGIWGVASTPFALLPVLFLLFGVAMVLRAIASIFRRN
jgi:hypothetical protein